MLIMLVSWLWMRMLNIYCSHYFGFSRLPSLVMFKWFTCNNRNEFMLKNERYIVTLIPFFTFSAFHALGYVRTNIIPYVFPRPAAPAGGNETAPTTWQANVQEKIKSWTDKYYGAAMRFVAQSEVTVIAVRLVLGLFR